MKDSITDEKNIRNGLHKSILHTFNELLFFGLNVSLDCIAFFERFGNTRSQKHETCLHSKQNSNKSRKVPTIIQILAIRRNRLFEFTLSSNRTSHSALFVDFHRCSSFKYFYMWFFLSDARFQCKRRKRIQIWNKSANKTRITVTNHAQKKGKQLEKFDFYHIGLYGISIECYISMRKH